MVAWLLYDSFIVWLILMPTIILSFKKKSKQMCAVRKRRLEVEFRDMILSVSSNMQAGYSVENAFREAYKETVTLHGADSPMALELKMLLRRLGNNEQIEDLLMDIAKRSDIQDIRDFAEVFQIAKRGGGDMRGIISNTAHILGGKQEVRREIETVVSDKRFENNIMKYMPFLLVFYISLTSNGYFESLYHNIFGWLIVTLAYIVYNGACIMSDRILDIKV
jgi:tight adherence protein B